MNNPTEILVHISAPSSAADDARHRQLAFGLLKFATARKHVLSVGNSDEKEVTNENTEDIGLTDKEVDTSPNPTGARSSAEYPATKRIKTLIQDESITSPLVNVARTPAVQVYRTPVTLAARAELQRPRTAPTVIVDTPLAGVRQRSKSESWETPPSVIPDSQPSRSLKRAFADASSSSLSEQISSPTVKRQQATRPSSSEEQGNKSTITEYDSSKTTASLSTEYQDGSTQGRTPSVELGSSQVPAALPYFSLSNGYQPIGLQDADEGPMQVSSSGPGSFQKVPIRSSQTTSVNSSPPEYPPKRPSPSAMSSANAPEPAPVVELSQNGKYTVEWIQIVPPPPPTLDNSFRTHMTPSLKTIVDRLPLDRFFNPVSQKRDLRVMERGYWRFEIPSGWEDDLRKKFWTFLRELVSSGKAGRGTRMEVTLTRLTGDSTDAGGDDPRADAAGNQQDQDLKPKELTDRVGIVKEEVICFCWGEVAGEVWLALWMASSRKLRGLGSTWIDSGGEIVITMA